MNKLSSEVQDVDRCIECNHNDVDENGICQELGQSCGICGHKCEFPSPSVSEAADKNSVSPKPKALSLSAVVIPESVSLDADQQPHDEMEREAMRLTINELEKERDVYRVALQSIATHPHNSYEVSSVDVADGHRCAAQIALTALEQPSTSGVFQNPKLGMSSRNDPKSSESASVHQPDVQQIAALARNKAAEYREQAERWQRNAERENRTEVKDLCYSDRDACLNKMAALITFAIELESALAASPVQPEEWVTCADCGQKRALSSLESRDTFVCRYCLSTKAVQVDEVSKEQ